MENKLTTLVLAIRFDSAFYKTFRFEGVDHARQMIGEDDTIKVYANHKDYINEPPTTAEYIAHKKSDLSYSGVPDGPFAIVFRYGVAIIPLDETKTFAFGDFNSYQGYPQKRWEVLGENEMPEFITLDEAEEVLHGK